MAIAVFFEVDQARAVNATWKSAASDTWLDPTAWTGGLPINPGDNATIAVTGSPYTVTLGQSLNLGSGSVTLNSSSATLSIAGGDVLTSTNFTLGSGTISGSVDTANLTLNSTTNGGGTFLFDRSNAYETGTGSSSDFLQISPRPTVPTVSFSTAGGSVNANILLTSTRGSANTIDIGGSSFTSNGTFTVNADPTDSVASDNVRSISPPVTNSVTGVMQFNTSTTFSSTLTNQGTVNIAAGVKLTASTLVQQTGQLNVTGVLAANTFNYTGGAIAGTGTINPEYLTLQPAANASAGITAVMDYSSGTSISGSIPAGMTVLIQADAGNSGSASSYLNYITYPNYPVNNGTLRLTSAYGSTNSVALNAGTFTNQGLLSIDPDPTAGVTNTRLLYGTIVNNPAGIISINTAAQIGNFSYSATLTNYGTFNVAAGVNASVSMFNQAGGTVNVPAGATLSGSTFIQEGGQLNVTGSVTSTTFNYSSGTINGNGVINPEYLILKTSGNLSSGVTALMDYPYSSNTITGSIPSGMTVLVQADSNDQGSGFASLYALSGVNPVNNGTLRLTSTYGSTNSVNLSAGTFTNQGLLSIDPDPTPGVTSKRGLSGTIINNPTGIIAVNTAAQFGNSQQAAPVANYGAFNLAAGVSASFTTFNQAGGTLNIPSGATLSGTTFVQQGGQINVIGVLSASNFNYAGGTIAGTGAINTPSLSFQNSNATTVSFVMNQTSSTVTGAAIPIGATVTAEATATVTSMGISVPTTNNGTINLTSVAGQANSVTLNAGSGAYSTINNGTINVSPDPDFSGVANNTRTLSGFLVNYGSVNIPSGVAFIGGTFNQAGGTLTLNGTLGNSFGGTFIFTGGTMTGTGTINSEYLILNPASNASAMGITAVLDSQSASTLSGSIPSGLTVKVQADAADKGSAAPTFSSYGAATPVNNGTIDLTSNYGATNTVSVNLNGYGGFINQGLISVDPDPTAGVSNTRTISGIITNNPTGIIAINTTTQFPASTNDVNVTNYGAFNVASGATAIVNSFNQAGGSLNLPGVLRAIYLELSGGTITGSQPPVTGSLTIDPTYNGGGTVDLVNLLSYGGSTLYGPSGWILPAGMTVTVDQPFGSTSQSASSNNPFTNDGTIRLASATGTTNSVQFAPYMLTNNGLISIDPDSSASAAQTSRAILGTLINDPAGTVLVNTNLNTASQLNSLNMNNSGSCNVISGVTAMFGTFNQSAGSLVVGGNLSAYSFNQLGGSLTVNGTLGASAFTDMGGTITGSANITASNLVFGSSAAGTFTNTTLAYTSGTIPEGLDLVYLASGTLYTFSSGTVLTNDGRIDLSSDGYAGTIQLPVFILTNNGLLSIDADTDGLATQPRYLVNTDINNTATGSIQLNANTTLGQVTNTGMVYIAPGVVVTQANGDFDQVSGSLDIEGIFNASGLALYGGTVTGAGTLGLTSYSYSVLTVGSGEQTIAANVSLSSNAWTVNAIGDLTLTGSLSIAGEMLNKTGAGTLSIEGAQFHTAGSSINASAGTVIFGTDPGSNLQLIVGNAAVQFSAANAGSIAGRNLASLNISTGGLVTIESPATSPQRMVLITSGLTFAGSLGNWQGQLDLTGNDLIVHNGDVVNLNDQLRSGYNGGGTPGSGIFSSTAAADTTHLTAVGMMPNIGSTGTAIYTSFDGQSVGSTDVLIKYTYFGDADLNGEIDGSDYSRIDDGYLTQATGWFNGDFNYDGVIDGSDYTLIDNAYNMQGAQLSASIAAAAAVPTAQIAGSSTVPEPATMGLFGILSAGLLTRRHRHRLATNR